MKNIVYLSQFKDNCGYASAARAYLRALHDVVDGNPQYSLRAHSIELESAKSISKVEEEFIDSLLFSDEDELEDYVSNNEYLLVWHLPPTMVMHTKNFSHDPAWRMFEKLISNCKKNINITVWEADKIRSEWFGVYDLKNTRDVIVPCAWNKQTFDEHIQKENHKLNVHRIPHVIEEPDVSSKPLKVDLEDKFVVFSMSQWVHRKGFEKLIQAFDMEFSHNQDAVLVIKTYKELTHGYLQKQSIEQQAKEIMDETSHVKKTVFTPRDHEKKANNTILLPWLMPYGNIKWLYEKADVFALATRGEGFGLTISEAIMFEKPVIVPNKGGHVDYISEANAELMFDCHLSPYVGLSAYHCDMNWYEPDLLSLRKKLRHAYNLWKNGELASIGKKNKDYVANSGDYSYNRVGNQMLSVIDRSYSERNTYAQVVEDLKDKHEGEDCYILTCGPSLAGFDKDELRKKLKGKKVFAIKQAYDFLPDEVDYHFFNCNNVQKYDYGETKTFAIGCSGDIEYAAKNSVWGLEQKYDLFMYNEDDKDYSKALCNTYDFESFTLDKKLERPWGPGMMTEVVLYFALHLGFKNIYTIGWDLEKPGTLCSNHFYKYEDKKIVRRPDAMKPDEAEKNIATSLKVYEWLKTKGVNLYVASPDSYVHPEVPRKLI